MPGVKAFLDTNIFVYLYSDTDEQKRSSAYSKTSNLPADFGEMDTTTDTSAGPENVSHRTGERQLRTLVSVRL
jgi:hypothetical protein